MRVPFFFFALSVNLRRGYAVSVEVKITHKMKYITLEYIKQHSRIDYDCEDSLLEIYGEAAEETVLNHLNRSYDDLVEAYGGVPKPIMQATLMLVDVSYQYRSPVNATSVSVVPYTFDILIKPYMQL